VPEQFWVYLKSLAHGDLGTAVLTGNPVLSDLAAAFPATLELATLAIILSVAVGVPLGLLAALYRDTLLDQIARVLSLLGHSLPVFWFGIVGLIVFYAGLQWVAGPGRIDVFYEGIVEPRTGAILIDSLLAGETEIFWNALGHLILPACILAYTSMAYIVRMTRSFTLEQLGQDYIIAARAKGLRLPAVVWGHILPNIAVQLVTILAISYGNLLEGAVLVEIVFSWPGIGQYMTNALMIGDMNAILACTLLIGLIFVLLNSGIILSDAGASVLLRLVHAAVRHRLSSLYCTGHMSKGHCSGCQSTLKPLIPLRPICLAINGSRVCILLLDECLKHVIVRGRVGWYP